ncbi:MAG: hypothetical protein NT154_08180, partial [Verrucomicrobia bacterium]|nr:hypothetical protein [Verrucomicrobiota bacterium]
MLGYVKKLLRKWVAEPNKDLPTPAVDASPAPAPRVVIAALPEGVSAHNNGGHQNGHGIELPLQPILNGLPLELQPRLTNRDAASLTIRIPLEKILAQLSSGSVKITFGELRQ